MIPKKIHYCWFGKNPLPEQTKQYIETWKKYCPDYEIIEWNEDNFDVNQNLYCKEAYEAKKWAFVSDYVRLKVLYDNGGIYMDTDIEVIKSLDNLLQYNWFSGFEAENKIQTGVIGAEIRNDFIKLLLEDYKKREFTNSKNKYDLTTNVHVLTKKIKKIYRVQLNNTYQVFGDNYLLLPFDYLCCKDYLSGKIYKTKHSYTIHHFDGSWLDNYGRLKIVVQRLFCFVFGSKNLVLLKSILKNGK